jgi:hypothetical protein
MAEKYIVDWERWQRLPMVTLFEAVGHALRARGASNG